MAYLDYNGLVSFKERLDQLYQMGNSLSMRFDPIDGDIAINLLIAADNTTASAISTFNNNVNVRTPDEMGIFNPGAGAVEVFYALANRLYLVWISNGVLETGLVQYSVNVQTRAITYSALGHTSMAFGVAEVDTEWTIEALPDDYTLPAATTSTLGGVKVGTGLSVTNTGQLSVTDYYDIVTQTNFKGILDDTARFYPIATDAASAAVIGNAFGETPQQFMPKAFNNTLILYYTVSNRYYLAWMNGTKMELAPLNVEVDAQTQATTLYARGRSSMAYGVAGVDTSWTITALPTDANGVSF